METNGQCGRWIALSHCWGDAWNRPLQTTQANIWSHLEGIDLKRMPKTFQDAVVVAKAMGIRYLWIDSLCIVQDDLKDWKQESRVVGTIYQNATITIAATHSRNSSEGCFYGDAGRAYVPLPGQSYGTTQKLTAGSDDKLHVCENMPEVTRAVVSHSSLA